MSSSVQVGANLDQMRQLSHRFDAKAADVDQLVTELSNLVGSGGSMGAVFWQGQLADRFRADWESAYVRNLRQLSQALREQARYVDESRRRTNAVLNGVDA